MGASEGRLRPQERTSLLTERSPGRSRSCQHCAGGRGTWAPPSSPLKGSCPGWNLSCFPLGPSIPSPVICRLLFRVVWQPYSASPRSPSPKVTVSIVHSLRSPWPSRPPRCQQKTSFLFHRKSFDHHTGTPSTSQHNTFTPFPSVLPRLCVVGWVSASLASVC